jgi:hypothetical protein
MLKASTSGLIDRAELAAAKCEMTDDQYDQEYECSFQAAIQGAYYGTEINACEMEGRITSVAYDPELKVYASFDIGWSDDTSIWWWQMLSGEIHIINHFSSNGENVQFYVEKLLEFGYKYAQFGNKPFVWLPHDARAKTLAAAGKSVQQQFLEGGFASKIVPGLSLQDGIQAVRKTLPKCYFDRENCADGINALSLYRREFDEDRKVFRDKPLHDWTSHAADSFRMLAVAWQEDYKPAQKPDAKFPLERTFAEMVKAQRAKRLNDE